VKLNLETTYHEVGAPRGESCGGLRVLVPTLSVRTPPHARTPPPPAGRPQNTSKHVRTAPAIRPALP